MNTKKIAITVPEDIVMTIDLLILEKGISRSKFITDILKEKISKDRKDKIKAAKIAYDAFIDDSDKIVLVFFDGEEEDELGEIGYYDMSFNVRTELNLFAEEVKMSKEQYMRLDGYLNDALTAEELEDDD